MSFFALLFALLIEQAKPLPENNPVHAFAVQWARRMGYGVDAGGLRHGWIAWGLTVAVPALLAALVHLLLSYFIGWLLAMCWSVAVLYVTLGFRQFSHYFTDIRDALSDGDTGRARELLARWKQCDASAVPQTELVRHLIEHSVIDAHRHVFGVLMWFAVFAALGLGPAGAVLYRMAEFVPRAWRHVEGSATPTSDALREVAVRAWHTLDWLPARSTAIGFAVVGNFEEAIDCWRQHAQRFADDNDGVVLAATSGALNVRLGGEPLRPVKADEVDAAPAAVEPTPGREPEVAHLRSVVGLVWRTVVLWMVLIALLTFARLIG